MNEIETLRGLVAQLAEVEVAQVGPDFSLESAALKSSIKRAALAASIRRDLGVNSPGVHAVATFGELATAVFGPKAGSALPSAAPAVAAPPQAAPSPVASSTAPAPLQFALSPGVSCGVDIEMVADLPEAIDYREHAFYIDSFTAEEIAYCLLQEQPRMHFAARWCAKEALYKCDAVFRGEKMANIEVARKPDGAVFFRHRKAGGVQSLPHAVSLSHTHTMAIAMVVAGGSGVPVLAPTPIPSPASVVDQPAAAATTAGGGPWSAWLTFACLLAVGLALYAVVRTFR